jgi:LEA14-like dessication related protein
LVLIHFLKSNYILGKIIYNLKINLVLIKLLKERNMKKRLIKLLLIIVTIVYIIIGGLLFINIQVMEAPDVIIEIEVSNITPEEATLFTKIDVDNQNSFDLSVKNLKIITTAPDGFKVADVEIAGGIIPGNEKKTFTNNMTISFAGRSPELLTSKITGDVGMSVLIIEKTIPLKMGVVTSLEKVINDFSAPIIGATIDIDEFTTEKITLLATIDVYNPNSFEMYIENLSGEIKTGAGRKIGEIEVKGERIPPKESIKMNSTGWVLLEVFNEEKIIFNLNGVAGVKIAGFEKSLPFNSEVKLNLPDLEELVLSKDNPVGLSIKSKNSLTLNGVVTEINLEVKNTFNVDLELRDIICSLNIVTNNETYLLGESSIEESLITEAGKTNSVKCEITVPLLTMVSKVPTSDWLLVRVTGRMTIKGLDPSVYVEINGYTDIHLFR